MTMVHKILKDVTLLVKILCWDGTVLEAISHQRLFAIQYVGMEGELALRTVTMEIVLTEKDVMRLVLAKLLGIHVVL